MVESSNREHFIPLRKSELVDALCADKDLPGDECEPFRQFCRLVTAIYHFESNHLLEKLKTAYAPFDPDADTKALARLNNQQKQEKLNALFNEFTGLMDRANFRHLSRDDIEPALQGTSEWGLSMDVDFRVFEHLAIFARGDTCQGRNRRRLWKKWRPEELQVPIYQRLVMIFKLRPHPRLGSGVDTEKVFFQLFKNIPKLDIKMLLPGARARISRFDRSKIGLSLLTGLGMTGWKILQEVAAFAQIFSLEHPAAWWALATGTLGYGARSYYGWQQTKQRYNLSLTQILYYQNLDTNAGVLFRLLDEAEEQEGRVAILGYYFLWRYGGEKGWTSLELEESIERYLESRANLRVGFEIHDALANLLRLNIIEIIGDRFRAQPLTKALRMLGWTWDHYFTINNLGPEKPPIPTPAAST